MSNLHITEILDKLEFNYGYLHVFFKTEDELLAVKAALITHHIYSRRYFYPSLNTLNYVETQPCHVSERLSKVEMSLPL